jgi:regulator of extracellular matrix RemA (YlzA/DUF370 family)
MKGVLHIGFYNYVTSDSVVGLFDYRVPSIKRLVKSAKAEKPRNVIDVTRGRKAQTLIVLTGDRYVISAIYRQQLAKRLGAIEVSPEEILETLKSPGTLDGPREKIDATNVDAS